MVRCNKPDHDKELGPRQSARTSTFAVRSRPVRPARYPTSKPPLPPPWRQSVWVRTLNSRPTLPPCSTTGSRPSFHVVQAMRLGLDVPDSSPGRSRNKEHNGNRIIDPFRRPRQEVSRPPSTLGTIRWVSRRIRSRSDHSHDLERWRQSSVLPRHERNAL